MTLDPDLMGPSLSAIDGIADQIDGIVVTNVFGYQGRVLEYENWCRKNHKILLQDIAATPVGFVSDGRCIPVRHLRVCQSVCVYECVCAHVYVAYTHSRACAHVYVAYTHSLIQSHSCLWVRLTSR